VKARPAVSQVLRKSCGQGNAQFRRSLYFVKDMKVGDVITEDCVRSVRPGYGLAPKQFGSVLGKRLKKSVASNTAVSYDYIEF